MAQGVTTGTRQMFRFIVPDGAGGRRVVTHRGGHEGAERDRSFRRVILGIAPGRVSTYGRVAAAAGYPQLHRAVARLLRTEMNDQLPWQRVVGAGGEIKLRGAAGKEQRVRLELEGVVFRGERVEMERCEQVLRPWEAAE